MAQYIMCHCTNIFRNDISPPFDERIGFTRHCQTDACPRRTTVADQMLKVIEFIVSRLTGGEDDIENIFFNLL
jgi:hypothetical protein